jgi:flagellin-like hook-associated protein FlgL
MNNIQSDYLAQSALNTLRVSARATSKLTEQMSTGRSIHSATDDAARLSVGNTMASQYQGIVRATHNLHDGISLAQTAEGALGTVVDILQRMRELAVQASASTLTDTDRGLLDAEYQVHKEQILNIVQRTTWNGHRLFNELSPTSFELQAGPDTQDRFTINIPQIYASGELVAFTNGDFESGTVGDTSITGWTVGNSRVTLDGNSQIGGWPTPTDTTKPSNSPGDTVAMTRGTFSSQLVAGSDATRGTNSLQLQSTSAGVASGYGILHGPYIISNNSTALSAGDSVSFDWKAQGGEDSYDVYAYLLNVDDGSTVKLLDSTGASSDWTTETVTVTDAGNYKFVFVSGSYDQTGGRALGARLFVDNITAPPTANATLNSTAISSQSGAGLSIAEVDLNISSVNMARASLGASINRINYAADNLAHYSHNIAESRSKIFDTDYAATSMALSRSQALDAGAMFVLKQSQEDRQASLGMIRSNDNLIKG